MIQTMKFYFFINLNFYSRSYPNLLIKQLCCLWSHLKEHIPLVLKTFILSHTNFLLILMLFNFRTHHKVHLKRSIKYYFHHLKCGFRSLELHSSPFLIKKKIKVHNYFRKKNQKKINLILFSNFNSNFFI
jgi:hypothetical protein